MQHKDELCFSPTCSKRAEFVVAWPEGLKAAKACADCAEKLKAGAKQNGQTLLAVPIEQTQFPF